MSRCDASYIMAVYNGQRYLAEAINTMVGQALAPREIIIVDDGSTDGTADIIKSYGDKVTYVHQENAGQSAARNHGVRIAKGQFIAFLDADDLIHPNKLYRQIPCFDEDADLVLCDAFAQNFWSPEVPDDQRVRHDLEQLTHSDEPWREHISTWLVRKSAFDQIGGFEEGRMFGEDSDWYDRLKASGAKMLTLNVLLAKRRLHPENLTRSNYEKHIDGIAELYKDRIHRLRNKKK